MERLKTYEIWKMIDENKDEMVGKRYVQVSGLLQDAFNFGDIAVVTEYCGITSLGSEKHSKIRLSWNGFEEWEEVKEPVDFMTAIESGCKVRVEHRFITEPYEKEQFSNHHKYFTELLEILGRAWDESDVRDIILNGKWYIEQEDKLMAKQVTLIDKDDCKNLLNRLKLIEIRIENDDLVTASTEISELISIVKERLDEDVCS